jgi:UDP-N-acetyl-D-glucosamine dehydrogenase
MTNLKKKILEKTACVGVIGLGYVGLPLVKAAFGQHFRVIGFDVDQQKIDKLNKGKSYIKHIPEGFIQQLAQSDRFLPTNDFSKIKDVDIVLICVPTPLTRYRDPDMSYVVKTTQAIAPYLRKDQLIILESTTYPGTSEEVIKPVLEATGLKSGVDFYLSYSPEREDPGNPNFDTASIPKVVGADGAVALDLANTFYQQLTIATVPVSSLATAEAVKLTENIFRCINIALVNELKIVFTAMGIDIWEVIEAAKTKPFGYMPFYPGPGLGGHCIPIDPFYLTWKAREYGLNTRFIELAGEINTSMPTYVVSRLAEALDQKFSKGLNGAKILIVGMAYKKNVDDIRESPAFVIIEHLQNRGAKVSYYDPYVPEVLPMREHKELVGMKCVAWDAQTLAGFDAALICTDHDDVDYSFLVNHSKLVLDTRNATKGIDDTGKKIFCA